MFTSTPTLPSYMPAGEQNYIPNTGEENAIFTYGNNGFNDETGPLLPRYYDEGHCHNGEGKKDNKMGDKKGDAITKSKKNGKLVVADISYLAVDIPISPLTGLLGLIAAVYFAIVALVLGICLRGVLREVDESKAALRSQLEEAKEAQQKLAQAAEAQAQLKEANKTLESQLKEAKEAQQKLAQAEEAKTQLEEANKTLESQLKEAKEVQILASTWLN